MLGAQVRILTIELQIIAIQAGQRRIGHIIPSHTLHTLAYFPSVVAEYLCDHLVKILDVDHGENEPGRSCPVTTGYFLPHRSSRTYNGRKDNIRLHFHMDDIVYVLFLTEDTHGLPVEKRVVYGSDALYRLKDRMRIKQILPRAAYHLIIT